VASGDTDRAIETYQRIVDRFGIPKYEQQAFDGIRRLR
jgi:hypothetical protein